MRAGAGLLGVLAGALGCVLQPATQPQIAQLPVLADGAGRPTSCGCRSPASPPIAT
jgi:hypothetical protein